MSADLAARVLSVIHRLQSGPPQPLEVTDLDALLAAQQIVARMAAASDEFSVSSIVSHRTGAGLVDVAFMNQVCQLGVVKAREIAWMLMEAAAVAEAEAMLLRFVKAEFDVPADAASSMLLAFRRYRAGEDTSLFSDGEKVN